MKEHTQKIHVTIKQIRKAFSTHNSVVELKEKHASQRKIKEAEVKKDCNFSNVKYDDRFRKLARDQKIELAALKRKILTEICKEKKLKPENIIKIGGFNDL